MKQQNRDSTKAFQTQVNAGGKAYVGNNYIYNHPTDKPIAPVKSIPHKGTDHFIGRSDELAKIHEKLYQQENTVAISSVAGMGGVGKTELAVKYARQHQDDYSGGICWFSVRDGNLATKILQFAQLSLKLEIPQKDIQGSSLEINQQVAWCWQNWQPAEGLVLVVLDDVIGLKNFADYLPTNNRFRVLITTRLRNIDANVEEIFLDVLSPEEALALLISIVGDNKINQELEIAKELCQWLGYLPLGVELVGRYIAKKPPHFTLAKMLKILKQQRLQQEALNPIQKTLSTAQRGVRAAFELCWLELDEQTQTVAALLSLFAAEIFAWDWVESITQSLNWDEDNVNTAIEQLYERHLVNYLELSDICYYKIHTLIREFLQEKLTALTENHNLKQAFVKIFTEIAWSIPNSPTLELINSVKNAIPHLAEIAENLTDAVSDNDLISPFGGLFRFYSGQGLYTLAEHWCEQCILVIKSRLGENHPTFATSLNYLALVYDYQARYDEAELLYQTALDLQKSILGENHPNYAQSLNNLAGLYSSQGKYDKAEPLLIQVLNLRNFNNKEDYTGYAISLNNLASIYEFQGRYDKAELFYQKALELYKQTLGENHPDYITSLNNLALLYFKRGKYDEVESLYIQVLKLSKRVLGENHPHFALSLNNLALFYDSQGKYNEAERLLVQALELRRRIFGENHPDFAESTNNLALVYSTQGRYSEAESLFKKALELNKRLLGENHRHFAISLSNLASLYYHQGRYNEAEHLYKQALELWKRNKRENHPDFAQTLNDLANLYSCQVRYNEAEPLYILALEIRKSTLGDKHPSTVMLKRNLAAFWNIGIESGHFSFEVLLKNAVFAEILAELFRTRGLFT